MQSSHPLERAVEAARDLGFRKLLQRHDAQEIEALLTWRRLELAAVANPAEAQEGEARLAAIEVRLQQARTSELRSGQVRSLALDGRAVMAALGAGPGRHVGQALAHLAQFVADHPDANEQTALEVELSEWAASKTNLLD
jgi:tRNA nucleotidyltransferase (CCA-adding enzyme)